MPTARSPKEPAPSADTEAPEIPAEAERVAAVEAPTEATEAAEIASSKVVEPLSIAGPT